MARLACVVYTLTGQIIVTTWRCRQIDYDIALKALEGQTDKVKEAGRLLWFVYENIGKRHHGTAFGVGCLFKLGAIQQSISETAGIIKCARSAVVKGV